MSRHYCVKCRKKKVHSKMYLVEIPYYFGGNKIICKECASSKFKLSTAVDAIEMVQFYIFLSPLTAVSTSHNMYLPKESVQSEKLKSAE